MSANKIAADDLRWKTAMNRWLPTKTDVWYDIGHSMYFYAVSINKNGGMSGILVEPPRTKSGRGAPLAKKYNTGLLFENSQKQYKEVPAHSVPEEYKEAAKETGAHIKEASIDDPRWKTAEAMPHELSGFDKALTSFLQATEKLDHALPDGDWFEVATAGYPDHMPPLDEFVSHVKKWQAEFRKEAAKG